METAEKIVESYARDVKREDDSAAKQGSFL